MNKISCEICLDLMPLVKDNIASKDSTNAVLDHIQTCESCRMVYGKENLPQAINDKRITKKIKKKLFYFLLSIAVVGILLGIIFATGNLMFYNIILMPLIGIISYFALKKKSYYVLILVFALIAIRWFFEILPEAIEYNDWYALFFSPLWWSILYTFLCVLGIVIGFLLHYGFKKEDTK